MAESEANPESQTIDENEEQKLKYLEFVQVAALHAVVLAARVYDYAKANAGPLKPGVQTVEGTVFTVWGPVYNKFHDVPNEVLKFVDRKVDESVINLDSHMPPVVKQVSTQAVSAAHKAPGAARQVVSEVKSAGIIGTASGLAKTAYTKYEPTAKELYSKYEPVAEHYAVTAWRSLNQLPLFPKAAQIVVPTAAFCSEKYNQTVQLAAEKGFRVSSYLPLVPTEKIARVFAAGEAQPQPVGSGGREEPVLAHDADDHRSAIHCILSSPRHNLLITLSYHW